MIYCGCPDCINIFCKMIKDLYINTSSVPTCSMPPLCTLMIMIIVPDFQARLTKIL